MNVVCVCVELPAIEYRKNEQQPLSESVLLEACGNNYYEYGFVLSFLVTSRVNTHCTAQHIVTRSESHRSVGERGGQSSQW